MRCPRCKHEKSGVYDTRSYGEETYRRRVCRSCGYKFITFEKAEESTTEITAIRRRQRQHYE